MTFKKILKYIGFIIIAYFIFCFALTGVYVLFSPHDDYSTDDTHNHSNSTHHRDSDSGVRHSYSGGSYSHGEDDDEWWFEEYGDYYNSAEAEDMGYYDDEDYLD